MKIQLLLSFALLLLSCSSNDDTTTIVQPRTANEVFLTNNIWKKNHYESIFYEDGNSTSTIYNSNSGSETLKFDLNRNVIYVNPDFTNSVSGKWNFTENEHVLNTNLRRESSGSSGYGTMYYFTKMNIESLSENELILVSDTLYATSGTSISKSITKYYFNN